MALCYPILTFKFWVCLPHDHLVGGETTHQNLKNNTQVGSFKKNKRTLFQTTTQFLFEIQLIPEAYLFTVSEITTSGMVWCMLSKHT